MEFPASSDGPWARYIVGKSEIINHKSQIAVARYPRLVAQDAACAQKLAKRTLTNLYNERPAWLALAHEKLDAAVFAAYGWPVGWSAEKILEKLLELNQYQSSRQNRQA